MDAPQSPQDVEPIELAIRQRIDDKLRILWNARSVVSRPGGYDCYGNPVAPHYEGRWEVGSWERVDGEREPRWTPIYQVRYEGPEGKAAYRAVGWWLVEHLSLWDRANAHWQAEMSAMVEEEERLRVEADFRAEMELREALSKHGRDDLKMLTHIGKGFGKGPRRHSEQAA